MFDGRYLVGLDLFLASQYFLPYCVVSIIRGLGRDVYCVQGLVGRVNLDVTQF